MSWSSAVRILVTGALTLSIFLAGIIYFTQVKPSNWVNNQGSLLLQTQNPLAWVNIASAQSDPATRDVERRADLAALEAALELNYQRYGAYTQPENMCADTSLEVL
jgi:hypothetical protein